jgi:ribosome-binding protein aMBF1 (putative translation factor)
VPNRPCALDALRIDAGLSKAQLARDIGRNDAVVRRLFTADVNPELRTIATLIEALDIPARYSAPSTPSPMRCTV